MLTVGAYNVLVVTFYSILKRSEKQLTFHEPTMFYWLQHFCTALKNFLTFKYAMNVFLLSFEMLKENRSGRNIDQYLVVI